MDFVRRGTGPPVLLVHGLGGSWRSWQPILPALQEQREVVAVNLPGFGNSPRLNHETTIATLADALETFVRAQGLDGVDTVGSSMGARLVLELARRGVGGTAVALDPGGFWNDRQLRMFDLSLRASLRLVRLIQPVLPAFTGNPVGRTALLSQFSARPWQLSPELVEAELRGYATAPAMDEALNTLVHGPLQEGAPAGSTPGRVVIGWGRRDRVTLPSQSRRALELFPGAELHWFERCGHFPQWDSPQETVELILASTG